jgi:hypothetical protein
MEMIFGSQLIADVDQKSLFTTLPFCHTALLPSEIRYRGLLTESEKEVFFLFSV